MSKHTPGLWTAIADSGDENADDGWYVLNDQETAIAVGLYEPDARLIAAAPDMLAALKAMTEYMAYAEPLGEDKAVFKNARAAIAKAEGAS